MKLRALLIIALFCLISACSDDDKNAVNGNQKAGNNPADNGKTATNAPTNSGNFDQVAVGTWVGSACEVDPNSGTPYTEILNLQPNGEGSVDYNVYQDANCQGQPQFQNGSTFKYTVKSFSNGQGQLDVQGQNVSIVVNGQNMTVTMAGSTIQYVRAN